MICLCGAARCNTPEAIAQRKAIEAARLAAVAANLAAFERYYAERQIRLAVQP